MKCEAFELYLEEWLKNTPKDKRLEDKYNIRPEAINDHIDTCDACFHKLMEAYESPVEPEIKPLKIEVKRIIRPWEIEEDEDE